jgi:hypothetical protein
MTFMIELERDRLRSEGKRGVRYALAGPGPPAIRPL